MEENHQRKGKCYSENTIDNMVYIGPSDFRLPEQIEINWKTFISYGLDLLTHQLFILWCEIYISLLAGRAVVPWDLLVPESWSAACERTCTLVAQPWTATAAACAELGRGFLFSPCCSGALWSMCEMKRQAPLLWPLSLQRRHAPTPAFRETEKVSLAVSFTRWTREGEHWRC